MTQKELNTITAKKVAASAFWNGDIFARYFADDFTMDIPSAPPGMPNYYSTWEAERCFEWLNRSVRSWDCEVREFYTTPNYAGLFWAIGQGEGDVFWGEHDGHLSTAYYLKIEFSGTKISHISWRLDGFAMLRAAGREPDIHYFRVPETESMLTGNENPGFEVNLYSPEIDAYVESHKFNYQGKDAAEVDMIDRSPEAVAARIQRNLAQYVCGVEREKYRKLESCSPSYKNGAIFLGEIPMPDAAPDRLEELMARRWGWAKVCSPWMYRDPRGKICQTDDPHVYFAEMNCHGSGAWETCGVKIGHYKQDYLLYLRFDDAGRVEIYDEILSAVNVLNSVGAPIVNFPYYH